MSYTMSYTTGVAVATLFFLILRYLNRTDIPTVKNIPVIPGVPVFGNLIQLGNEHAKVASQWAKRYGPVFQVRLGGKVGRTLIIKIDSYAQPLSRESFL